MTTWIEIGTARVALADCRDLLPEITGVSCLLTDPPYRVTSGGNTKPGFGGWMANDYDNSGKIVACDLEWSDWLPLIPAALAEQAHAYIFSNDRNLPDAWRAAESVGLDFHRLLVWNKRAAMPNRWYMQCCEFVLFMKQGLAYPVNDCGAMALQTVFQQDESDHHTENLSACSNSTSDNRRTRAIWCLILSWEAAAAASPLCVRVDGLSG